jgi:hypothetical protein
LIKIIGTSIFDESFQPPFALLLFTRTFFATPLAEKMHSLLLPVINPRILFPLSLLVPIFHPSLINVPIIHIEGF